MSKLDKSQIETIAATMSSIPMDNILSIDMRFGQNTIHIYSEDLFEEIFPERLIGHHSSEREKLYVTLDDGTEVFALREIGDIL